MANGRHSFVAFYPSDWIAGTARLPRMHRSVYFDVCCYIWDTAVPVPDRELRLIVADVPNGMQIVDDLIAIGKLAKEPNGGVVNDKALHEAEKAYRAWAGMSAGGKHARSKGDAKVDGKPPAKPHGEKDAMGARQNQNQNQNQTSPNGEGRAPARKTACPDDFKPAPSEGSKTAERMAKWPPDHLVTQIEKFIAHHQGKGNRHTDWQRTWTTWVLNDFDGGRSYGNTSRKPAGNGSGNGLLEACVEDARNGPDD